MQDEPTEGVVGAAFGNTAIPDECLPNRVKFLLAGAETKTSAGSRRYEMLVGEVGGAAIRVWPPGLGVPAGRRSRLSSSTWFSHGERR
jgi:hypothetical protein